MVAGGGCVVAPRGGMHSCSGGMRGCSGGGGVHGCSQGDMMRYGDTVNERAVRILLECILVR